MPRLPPFTVRLEIEIDVDVGEVKAPLEFKLKEVPAFCHSGCVPVAALLAALGAPALVAPQLLGARQQLEARAAATRAVTPAEIGVLVRGLFDDERRALAERDEQMALLDDDAVDRLVQA